jgi:hypothetical protein
MGLAPELVSVKTHIRKQTEKAIMIEHHDEMLWIPLSQIESTEDTPDGFTRVTMSAWIAKEKEII